MINGLLAFVMVISTNPMEEDYILVILNRVKLDISMLSCIIQRLTLPGACYKST